MKTGPSVPNPSGQAGHVASVPDDGVLEALKWLALVAMVVDHLGAIVLGVDKAHWTYAVGRLAYPLFAMILGVRLSSRWRTSGRIRGATALRLFVWGLISSPFFVAASGRWWPPAIFFTLALGTVACVLMHSSWPIWGKGLGHAAIVLLSAGCDYFMPGVYLVAVTHAFSLRPSAGALLGIATCAAGLVVVNGSLFTLVAFPLLSLSYLLKLRLQPHPRFFYFFYPTHLAALAVCVRWHRLFG